MSDILCSTGLLLRAQAKASCLRRSEHQSAFKRCLLVGSTQLLADLLHLVVLVVDLGLLGEVPVLQVLQLGHGLINDLHVPLLLMIEEEKKEERKRNQKRKRERRRKKGRQ